MFHLTWSAVEYATYVEETKNCTTCQCTPYIHQKKNERQWIFNGMINTYGATDEREIQFWMQWERCHLV